MGKMRLACGVACVGLAMSTVSCARLGMDDWRFWNGNEADTAVASAPEVPSAPEATEAERETLLRQAVSEHMGATSGEPPRLLRRRPYYFQEYSVYAGGPESARISITETDSRLRPYIATVDIDKQRFRTRIHRDREEAQGDRNFLRDTGTETLSYEWRGGHWEKVGSFFVASATEEQVGGAWQPVVEVGEQATAPPAEDEEKGILGRAWSLISGK